MKVREISWFRTDTEMVGGLPLHNLKMRKIIFTTGHPNVRDRDVWWFCDNKENLVEALQSHPKPKVRIVMMLPGYWDSFSFLNVLDYKPVESKEEFEKLYLEWKAQNAG